MPRLTEPTESLPRLPRRSRFRGAPVLRSAFLAGMAGAVISCAPTTGQELTYRVRADLDAPLNADTGWAAPTGAVVTMTADQPFRLRMEASSGGPGGSLVLQARRNGGAWAMVDAQSFPYPKRELELDFAEHAPGSPPPGWLVRSGMAGDLAVVQDGPDRVLRAQGGASGLLATYPAPWPVPEFSYAARFRLPAGDSQGFALVFAHVDADNYGLLRVHPDRGLTLVRVTEGRETVLARQPVEIARGSWHETEIKVEEGRLELGFDDRDLLTLPMESVDGQTGLALPAGSAVDIAELVIEGVASTPGVSIIATEAYANGAATDDLLPAPFAPGFGLSLRLQTPVWNATGSHGEFEWPLVIRRFADGPALNESGDRFEFRMVGAPALPGANAVQSPIARITLAVPPGHLGGTYVENPGRIGPWQARNGDLYFIMEPAETDNKFMMLKSTDGGVNWREVDGANHPKTGDLESVDGRMIDGRIHMVHQVTSSVRYHVFRTSDHPTDPDSWELTDEVAARVEAIAQTATMAVRSDKSVVSIFLGDRLYYAIRAVDGSWSAPVAIDPGADFVNAGPQAVVGRGDIVHLAYFSDDGIIWYRRMLPDGTLTARQELARGAGTGRAEYGAVLPLAYDAPADTLTIAYRLDDGSLWERQVRGGSAPTQPTKISHRGVITDAVDSQQPAADLVVDGTELLALFVDEEMRSLYSTRRDGDQWQDPVLRVDGIEGSWVRGNVIRRPDGQLVYGYVYDAGSQGGSGFNRYKEILLDGE